MYQLPIYSVKERRPENGEGIIYLKYSGFYECYDFRPVVVEYGWLCVDEEGFPNGNGICYDKDVPQPEGTILGLSIGSGEGLEDEDLYMRPEDVEDILVKHGTLKLVDEEKKPDAT